MGKLDLLKRWGWVLWMGASLFVSGWWQRGYVYGLVGVTMLVWVWLWRRKRKVENQLFEYLVVMLLMGLTLLWTKNTELVFGKLITFLLGGGWLYLGSLMKEEKDGGLAKWLVWLVTILGVGWLVIFGYNQLFMGSALHSYSSLIWWSTSTKDHHHLGDWWALVVLSQLWLIATGKIIKNKKYRFIHILLVLVGMVGIYFSRSRSAILSLILGIVFVFGGIWKKKDKLFVWVIGLAIASFLLLGISKPTIINRQYWLQAAVGWWRYPLGLGMGNFGEISGDVRNHMFGLKSFSSVTHNVLLEFLVGMGVLGLTFWWWFIKNIIEPFVVGKIKPSLAGGLVLALGVNFLFDSTYFIAPMWWVFMFLVGLVDKRGE